MNWDVLSSMSPIGIDGMDSIRLMDRVDTKYLTDEKTLSLLLEDVSRAGFLIFEIAGRRLCSYDSLYYDTQEYGMYLAHHNRRLTRQKVRTRMYSDTHEAFLEIKLKNNHGRTRKKRIGIDPEFFGNISGLAEAPVFLGKYSSIGAGMLSPSVTTSFRRITLVDPDRTERITIDTEVRFVNRRSGVVSGLGEAVIIEVKQDGHKRSTMRGFLLTRRVKPFRISKYCMGVAMTAPGIKRNRFLGKLKKIEKINNI